MITKNLNKMIMVVGLTGILISACNSGGGGNSSGAAAGGSSDGGSSSNASSQDHQGNGGNGGNQSDPCAILDFSGSANQNFNAAGIFSDSPMDTNALSYIVPLGNLNPPGHTYPTDHMYLVLKNANANTNNVFAAAGGTVFEAYQPGGSDWKLVVQVDKSFFYYYDHMTLANGIQKGTVLSAGQLVGTNSGQAAAVDFGVINYNNAPLAGILDSCIAKSEAYVDSPLKYFGAGNLRTTLYGLAGNKDGRIDYDQAGKLVGDWMIAGQQTMQSQAIQLAFTYHVGSNSMRIAVGGTLTGGASTYAVENGAPDFSTITKDSGQVDFQIFQTTNGDDNISNSQFGVLSVQMISDTQIKVEIFQGVAVHGTFDGNAQIYNR